MFLMKLRAFQQKYFVNVDDYHRRLSDVLFLLEISYSPKYTADVQSIEYVRILE